MSKICLICSEECKQTVSELKVKLSQIMDKLFGHLSHKICQNPSINFCQPCTHEFLRIDRIFEDLKSLKDQLSRAKCDLGNKVLVAKSFEDDDTCDGIVSSTRDLIIQEIRQVESPTDKTLNSPADASNYRSINGPRHVFEDNDTNVHARSRSRLPSAVSSKGGEGFAKIKNKGEIAMRIVIKNNKISGGGGGRKEIDSQSDETNVHYFTSNCDDNDPFYEDSQEQKYKIAKVQDEELLKTQCIQKQPLLILKQIPDLISIQNSINVNHDLVKNLLKKDSKLVEDNQLSHPKRVSLLECPICSTFFEEKDQLYTHILMSHPDSEESQQYNVCRLCPTFKFYPNFQTLYEHGVQLHGVHFEENNKNTTDTDTEFFKCTADPYECSKVFKSKRQLLKHTSTVHPTDEELKSVFNCNICGKNFVTKMSLHRHQRVHLRCKMCNNGFQNADTLEIHESNCKGRNKGYNETSICQICAKVLKKRNMRNHIKLVHEKDFNFYCHICGRGFIERAHLNNHVNSHSSGQPGYKCRIPGCKKIFSKLDELRNHSTKSHSEELFDCSQCDKKFLIKRSLDEHIIINHPSDSGEIELHYCDCGKSFKVRNYLLKHGKRCPQFVYKIRD